MDPNQQKFLADELFSLVLQATLQRSLTYDEKVSDQRKAEFKQGLRDRLEALAKTYVREVPSDTHIENIENLAKDLSTAFSDCLFQGRFRIGSALKALNLYLKYLWCLGEIHTPPHCPFDSIIIKRLRPQDQLNWTELDDIKAYGELVALAEKAAGGPCIAEWELLEYNKA